MKRLKSLNLERIDLVSNTSIDHMAEIVKAVGQIDCLTDHLDAKLGSILKLQQNQLVQSYKQHMKKIREQVQLLQQIINDKDKKISMLESDGMTAELLKRINFLQQKQSELLTQLAKKSQIIKGMNLQKQINKSQNKRLQQRIKQLIQSRAKSFSRFTNQIQHAKSIQTFQTQVTPDIQLSRIQKINFSSMKEKKKYSNTKSQKQSLTLNPETQHSSSIGQLQKSITIMQKQIKNLTKANLRMNEQFKDAQNFFLTVVAEMKKSIVARKKFKQCSYEDFRKEDKIQLLIKILSNDQILITLYNKIFGKTYKPPTSYNQVTVNFRKYSKSHAKVQFLNSIATRVLQ